MGWLWALTAAQVAAGTIVPWPLNISFEQLLRATDEVSPRPTWEGTAVNVGAGDGISYDETASLFAAGFGGSGGAAAAAAANIAMGVSSSLAESACIAKGRASANSGFGSPAPAAPARGSGPSAAERSREEKARSF